METKIENNPEIKTKSKNIPIFPCKLQDVEIIENARRRVTWINHCTHGCIARHCRISGEIFLPLKNSKLSFGKSESIFHESLENWKKRVYHYYGIEL